MGQKVNPVGMRIGVNRDWNSRWYADDKEYPVYLNEDIKIRKYLEGSLKEALLSHIEIERTKSERFRFWISKEKLPHYMCGENEIRR